MKRQRRTSLGWLGGAVFLMLLTAAGAHEPIFGIGPHVIGQYGVGFEVGVEDGEAVHLALATGLGPDLGVSWELPRRFGEAPGWESPSFRAKWRFYRNDGPGGSNQAAVVLGYRFPPIQGGPEPGAALIAATVGRESRLEYFFAGLRYLRTVGGSAAAEVRPARNTLLYDLAVGVRPIRTDYEDPDLVLLVEINGRTAGGQDQLGFGPGMLFSWRNVMVKAGINLLFRQEGRDVPLGEATQSFVAVELHTAPFAFLYRE